MYRNGTSCNVNTIAIVRLGRNSHPYKQPLLYNDISGQNFSWFIKKLSKD